jgi:hypothetical protein
MPGAGNIKKTGVMENWIIGVMERRKEKMELLKSKWFDAHHSNTPVLHYSSTPWVLWVSD